MKSSRTTASALALAIAATPVLPPAVASTISPIGTAYAAAQNPCAPMPPSNTNSSKRDNGSNSKKGTKKPVNPCAPT